MKYLFNLIASICFLVALIGFFNVPASAQEKAPSAGEELQRFVEQLNRSAAKAALSTGTAQDGAIACNPLGFMCTCKGAFDCAWLAYGCSEIGGIRGFNGECFLPNLDQEVNRAVLDLRLALLPGTLPSTCDGIFCSCSGGKDSDDCKNLSATCADDVSCVGDNCGCVGGTASE